VSGPARARGDLLRTGERLIQTLWVGALWTVGYIVAPALFQHLDSAQAGRLAGELFTVVAFLSVACGTLLLLARIGPAPDPQRRLRGRLVALMMILVAVGEWGVRPVMEAARLPDGTPGPGFGLWHGVASVLYLLASLGGVWLVVAEKGGSRPDRGVSREG
jgi:hypothetical protein